MAVIFVGAVTFFSCQKQQITQNYHTGDPVLDKILTFKNKVENPSILKANEMMTTDSVVWYIEAALNYTYCIVTDTTVEMPETKIDSISFELSISDGYVNLEDVVTAYNNVKQQMLTKLESIEAEHKQISVVDVDFTGDEFKAYFIMMYGNEQPNQKRRIDTHIYGDWHWGAVRTSSGYWQPQGMCDWTYVFEKDAGTEINRVLHYSTGVLYGVYFTDIDFIEKTYNPNDPDWNLFYRADNPYRIWTPDGNGIMNHSDFWAGFDTEHGQDLYHPCIEETELNWYKDAGQHAINQIKTHLIPAGYSYKSFEFEGWTGHNGDDEHDPTQTYYYHSLRVWYGYAHRITPHAL